MYMHAIPRVGSPSASDVSPVSLLSRQFQIKGPSSLDLQFPSRYLQCYPASLYGASPYRTCTYGTCPHGANLHSADPPGQVADSSTVRTA